MGGKKQKGTLDKRRVGSIRIRLAAAYWLELYYIHLGVYTLELTSWPSEPFVLCVVLCPVDTETTFGVKIAASEPQRQYQTDAVPALQNGIIAEELCSTNSKRLLNGN